MVSKDIDKVVNELFEKRVVMHKEILNNAYAEAEKRLNEHDRKPFAGRLLPDNISLLNTIDKHAEKGKGVLAVLITSLTHKISDPNQDIRKHQDNMTGGYSGRGVDMRDVTPFMKKKKFPAMAESGWLTRSLVSCQ